MKKQLSIATLVALRVVVGFGFTIIGLQLFTGPYTLGEFAWATFFVLGGVFILSVLASFPFIARPTMSDLSSTFFSSGKTVDDATRRVRAFQSLSWLMFASASVWLLLWIFVLARTDLAIYEDAVAPVFSGALGFSFALLGYSFVLRFVAMRRRGS